MRIRWEFDKTCSRVYKTNYICLPGILPSLQQMGDWGWRLHYRACRQGGGCQTSRGLSRKHFEYKIACDWKEHTHKQYNISAFVVLNSFHKHTRITMHQKPASIYLRFDLQFLPQVIYFTLRLFSDNVLKSYYYEIRHVGPKGMFDTDIYFWFRLHHVFNVEYTDKASCPCLTLFHEWNLIERFQTIFFSLNSQQAYEFAVY